MYMVEVYLLKKQLNDKKSLSQLNQFWRQYPTNFEFNSSEESQLCWSLWLQIKKTLPALFTDIVMDTT